MKPDPTPEQYDAWVTREPFDRYEARQIPRRRVIVRSVRKQIKQKKLNQSSK